VKVLSAHRGNDTGGTGWRIANAFRDDPDVTFRSSCNSSSVLPYLAYPEDVPWDWSQIQELYLASDVFHARNDWSTYERLAGSRHPLPRLIHYHGTRFRVLNAKLLREQGQHQGLVSTLDLWLIAPDRLEWLPSPYDLEALSALRI
jgi:hypothetical protein